MLGLLLSLPAALPVAAPFAAPFAAPVALPVGLHWTLPWATPQQDVDFLADVYPIFEASCFECHGPKKQKGKLRLDTRKGLFEGDEDFVPVVPGQPDLSVILELTTLPADDPDVMPAEGEHLTDEQIATLRAWIEQGAPWAEPERVPVEKVLELPALDEGQAAARDRAVEALSARGVRPLQVAVDLTALDLNVSLLRGAAGDAEAALTEGLEPVLVWANFSGTGLTDAGLEQLGRCSQLRRLNLSRTAITDAGLAQLAGLEQLTYLNLYGTGVTDAGLARLAGLERLEKLYLWQTEVTDAGVKTLLASLPALKVNRGAELAVIVIPKAQGPLNADCLLTGKPVNPACTSVVDGVEVAFCCGDCKSTFDADPSKFAAQLAALKAAQEADPEADPEAGPEAGPEPAPEPDTEPDTEPAVGAAPINETCPVSGQPVKAGFTSTFEDQTVGFCCEKCKAAFDKEPAKFAEKLRGKQAGAGPFNTLCPLSGEPVKADQVSTFEDFEVAFCCGKCKAAFDQDPQKFAAKIAAMRGEQDGK